MANGAPNNTSRKCDFVGALAQTFFVKIQFNYDCKSETLVRFPLCTFQLWYHLMLFRLSFNFNAIFLLCFFPSHLQFVLFRLWFGAQCSVFPPARIFRFPDFSFNYRFLSFRLSLFLVAALMISDCTTAAVLLWFISIRRIFRNNFEINQRLYSRVARRRRSIHAEKRSQLAKEAICAVAYVFRSA